MNIKSVQVKVSTRYFIVCPICGAEHDVDAYEAAEIECVCDKMLYYDNGNPEKAESV